MVGNHEHVSFSIVLDYELCVDISIHAISYRIWLNLYKIYYIETKMEMDGKLLYKIKENIKNIIYSMTIIIFVCSHSIGLLEYKDTALI